MHQYNRIGINGYKSTIHEMLPYSYGFDTFPPCELGVKSYELRNNLSIFFYTKSRN